MSYWIIIQTCFVLKSIYVKLFLLDIPKVFDLVWYNSKILKKLPYFLKKFQLILYFCPNALKNSCNFWKVIALIFHYRFWQICEKLSTFGGGLRPRTAHYSPVLSEKLHFSRIFPIIMQIFINFNADFWKITRNFRALPNSKISFHPRKMGPPQNFDGPPSTEKSCINCWYILLTFNPRCKILENWQLAMLLEKVWWRISPCLLWSA